MKRHLALSALLVLAGCNEAASDAQPTPIASANPADCAKVTLDIPPERFAQGRENFAVGSTARTRLDENFTIAIAQACDEGLMARQPLIDPRSKEKNTLFLANAPEANIASIYFNEGATWMEGPFVDGEGHVQVPGPDAIKEAIYCHTIGATEQEQETTGRCLPD